MTQSNEKSSLNLSQKCTNRSDVSLNAAEQEGWKPRVIKVINAISNLLNGTCLLRYNKTHAKNNFSSTTVLVIIMQQVIIVTLVSMRSYRSNVSMHTRTIAVITTNITALICMRSVIDLSCAFDCYERTH